MSHATNIAKNDQKQGNSVFSGDFSDFRRICKILENARFQRKTVCLRAKRVEYARLDEKEFYGEKLRKNRISQRV
jgi:hypothetical protein